MERIYITLVAIALSIQNTTQADTWAPPAERDYYSDNNMYVAHVTPSKNQNKAKLEVFKISDSQRQPLWACSLGNEEAPRKVFITNDGNYVATLDEWGRWHLGGYGDYVVAFYDRRGLIKNYSLKQVFHDKPPAPCNWLNEPILFDEFNDTAYLCVRSVRGENRWIAWNVQNGEEVNITPELLTRWNEKGREWALKEIHTNKKQIAYELLAKLKNPEDKSIFQDLLKNGSYSSGGVPKRELESIFRVCALSCHSRFRKIADDFLSSLEGKPIRKGDFNGYSHNDNYNYLGVIAGKIDIPQLPENINGCLCIYLIPKSIPDIRWRYSENIIALNCSFGRMKGWRLTQLLSGEMPFVFEGIEPGEYKLKAILIQTEYREISSCDCRKKSLKSDHYESDFSSVFEVKAGEKITGIVLECTNKITDESY